jgi:hypothetical protein
MEALDTELGHRHGSALWDKHGRRKKGKSWFLYQNLEPVDEE